MGAVLAALLMPVWLHSEQQGIGAIAARESHALLAAENAIQTMLRERLGDAAVLLRSGLIGDSLDHPDTIRRRRLSGRLVAYCESPAASYRQFSLVGLDGREWMRIDRGDGRCASVPRTELRDLASQADIQAALQRNSLALHVVAYTTDSEGSKSDETRALILRFEALVPETL